METTPNHPRVFQKQEDPISTIAAFDLSYNKYHQMSPGSITGQPASKLTSQTPITIKTNKTTWLQSKLPLLSFKFLVLAMLIGQSTQEGNQLNTTSSILVNWGNTSSSVTSATSGATFTSAYSCDPATPTWSSTNQLWSIEVPTTCKNYIVDDAVQTQSDDAFCTNIITSQTGTAYIEYVVNPPATGGTYTARTFLPIITQTSLATASFATAKVSLSLYDQNYNILSPGFTPSTVTGTNSVFKATKLMTFSYLVLRVTYNSVTPGQTLSLCIDSIMALQEYSVSQYIQASTIQNTVNCDPANCNITPQYFGNSETSAAWSFFSQSTFNQVTNCPAISNSGGGNLNLRGQFTMMSNNAINHVYGWQYLPESVLVTSIYAQFGSSHPLSRGLINYGQKWSYSTSWNSSGTTTETHSSSFYKKLTTPEIRSMAGIKIVNGDAFTLQLCTMQLFGFAFCQAIQGPIINTVNTTTDSGSELTFSQQVNAQYDTVNGLINNPFCSLTLQLTMHLNGVSYPFFTASSKAASSSPSYSDNLLYRQTISKIAVSGQSIDVTLSFNPNTLEFTYSFTGMISDTTNGTQYIYWTAVDSRDPASPNPVLLYPQQRIFYLCDQDGMYFGGQSLTFQNGSLSDNKTFSFKVGNGTSSILFNATYPYCQNSSCSTLTAYYINATTGQQITMSTDAQEFAACQNLTKTCLLWDPLNRNISILSNEMFSQNFLAFLKFQICGYDSNGKIIDRTNIPNPITRYIYLNPQYDAVFGCRNTLFQYQIINNEQIYGKQNLNIYININSNNFEYFQINFTDSCSVLNDSSACDGATQCGLYYYNLTAVSSNPYYLKASDILGQNTSMQTQLSSDTHSLQLIFQSVDKSYSGLTLVYSLVVGLQTFKNNYTNLDPKKTYSLEVAFFEFYPLVTSITINYQLGLTNNIVKLPSYFISLQKFSMIDYYVRQIDGISLPTTLYSLNKKNMTFSIITDNEIYAGQTVKFQFTGILSDPSSTNNSDLILTVNFNAVPLKKILEHNSPPYFTNKIQNLPQIPCLDSDQAINWNFDFPLAVDDQNNTIKLQVLCENFDSQVFIAKQIKGTSYALQLNCSYDSLSQPNKFICKVQLQDQFGAKQSYDLIFVSNCVTASYNFIPTNKPNRTFNLTNLKPIINQISERGLVVIKWNVEMLIPQNKTLIQTQNCYSYPPFQLDIKPGSQKSEFMNFNFSIVNMTYKSNYTQFAIIFDKPQDIAFYTYDFLAVVFNNTSCFQSIQGKYVDRNKTLITRLPKQNWPNVIQVTDMMRIIVKVILYVAVCSIIFNYFTQFVLNLLLSMISNLCLIVHMFLVTLNFPLNLMNFMNIILPLISFSVIPADQLAQAFEQIFKFSEIQTDYALSDQFNTIGYSSIFCIFNVGSLYFTIQFGPILPGFIWACSKYKIFSCIKPLQMQIESQYKQFFWNGLILFCNQNYLLICVVSFIESNDLRISLQYSATEIYCSVLAVCGLVFAVGFPLLIFCKYRSAVKPENIAFTKKEMVSIMVHLNLKYEDFSKKEYAYLSKKYQNFIDTSGVLIKDIDIAKTGATIAVLCPTVDLIFQLILAIVVTRLVNWPVFSLFFFNFILQAYLMFFIYNSPYRNRKIQFWAIFDKIVLLGLNYHLFLFTDYVTDPNQYAEIANSVIYIVGACSLFKIAFELFLLAIEIVKCGKQMYASCQTKRSQNHKKSQLKNEKEANKEQSQELNNPGKVLNKSGKQNADKMDKQKKQRDATNKYETRQSQNKPQQFSKQKDDQKRPVQPIVQNQIHFGQEMGSQEQAPKQKQKLINAKPKQQALPTTSKTVKPFQKPSIQLNEKNAQVPSDPSKIVFYNENQVKPVRKMQLLPLIPHESDRDQCIRIKKAILSGDKTNILLHMYQHYYDENGQVHIL